MKQMKKSLQELDENAKAYKQKIYEMPKNQEKSLTDKHQKYVEMINQLKVQVKAKEQEMLASKKMDDEGSDDPIYTNGKLDFNKMTSKQAINHGLNTQQKSK